MKILQNFVNSAPENPGVYKIYGSSNALLYIGKAKNLKKRLSQYLKPLSSRMQQILEQTSNVEFVIASNEVEALILESELIKKLQPKYNVLLKDDKSFPFIKITTHPYPRIIKYRGKKHEDCYGPFVSSFEAKQTIVALQKIFLIRGCADSFFTSRKKPCMENQLKRCSAPCVNKITHKDYSQAIKGAKSVLKGKTETIQNELLHSMQQASEAMLYEKAALYRDRIRVLQNLHTISQNQIYTKQSADYIGIYFKNEQGAINIISYSVESGFGHYSYNFEYCEEESSPKEMLESLLLQFYSANIPQNIYCNKDLSANFNNSLAILHNKPINIKEPKSTYEIETLKLSVDKAKNHLESKITGQHKSLKHLKKIKDYFALKDIPKRLEAYDNSHNFGDFAVGSMVVFTEEGFDKTHYRIFKIKESSNGDDHQMMKEILERRFKKDCPRPDFMLIDGGKGHINMIKQIVKDIPFVCITKGDARKAENDHFYSSESDIFNIEDKELRYFLQTMRDEVHCHAIKAYRKMHNKSYTKSTIDDIPNIGTVRKKILLSYFKNIEEIKNSSVEDLARIKGIGKLTALNIWSFLNK